MVERGELAAVVSVVVAAVAAAEAEGVALAQCHVGEVEQKAKTAQTAAAAAAAVLVEEDMSRALGKPKVGGQATQMQRCLGRWVLDSWNLQLPLRPGSFALRMDAVVAFAVAVVVVAVAVAVVVVVVVVVAVALAEQSSHSWQERYPLGQFEPLALDT